MARTTSSTLRTGRAVLVFVTEPFSRSRKVKVDRWNPKDPDQFTALMSASSREGWVALHAHDASAAAQAFQGGTPASITGRVRAQAAMGVLHDDLATLERRVAGQAFTRLAASRELSKRALAVQAEAVARLLEGSELRSAPAATGPLRQSPRDVVADSALLVGDAAGFVDAITGEGMSLTLLDSALAAEVLSHGLRRGRLAARDLAAYRRQRALQRAQLTALTELILGGIRFRPLAHHVVRNLARHPDVFGQILAVNAGAAPLWSLGLGGLRRALLR